MGEIIVLAERRAPPKGHTDYLSAAILALSNAVEQLTKELIRTTDRERESVIGHVQMRLIDQRLQLQQLRGDFE